jgi:Dihydrodipicolinate synthetase family
MADTLVLSATTGEFHTQTFDERVAIFETVKDAVGDQIPLVAGVGCASTIETVALAKKSSSPASTSSIVSSAPCTLPCQKNHFTRSSSFPMSTVSNSISVSVSGSCADTRFCSLANPLTNCPITVNRIVIETNQASVLTRDCSPCSSPGFWVLSNHALKAFIGAANHAGCTVTSHHELEHRGRGSKFCNVLR